MKRIAVTRAILLCTTLSVAGINSALAADMDYIRPTAKHTTPVEYGSGWYLRGDIGFAVHSGTDGTYYSSGFGSGTSYASEDLSAAESYSVGVGYIFNEMLRGDITLEHSQGTEWEGRSKSVACGTVPGDCYFEADAELKRTSIMANGYVSMGRYGGFSPYLGGGIGVTNVSWSDYDFQQACDVDPGEDCLYGTHPGGSGKQTFYGPSGTVPTSSGMALTYALAAGIDYKIDHNWTVDLGYKWTHISENLMIEENAAGVGFPAGDSSFNGINLHEIKLGLRYEIW